MQPAAHDDAAARGGGALLGREGGIYPSFWERLAPYVAEFAGTFLLTSCYLCGKSTPSMWSISAVALMLFALMSSLLHVSGACLNPSVSIALWLSGRQLFSKTWRMCLSQVLGAAVAAALTNHFVFGPQGISVRLGPEPGFGAAQVATVELLYTGMICFVYLNCVASPRNNPARDQNGFAALAVGFTFIAGGHASQGVSGTVMNPAIAWGLQLVDFGAKEPDAWPTFYLWWEIMGAFLAAGAQRVVRPGEVSGQGLSADSAAAVTPGSSALFAEFLGTFYVVFTKAMVHRTWSSYEPWAVASAMLCMIYSVRDISGAMFNPAVTLAAFLSGKLRRGRGRQASSDSMAFHLNVKQMSLYMGAQVFAGLMASSAFAMVHGDMSLPIRDDTIINPHVSQAIKASTIIIGETFFTSVLCYVVLATCLTNPMASSKGAASQHNNIAGLAVAGAHLVSGVSVGKVSGSILNPAVSIGFSGLAALSSSRESIVLPYVGYQVFGAILATAAFAATHGHLDEARKDGDGAFAAEEGVGLVSG